MQPSLDNSPCDAMLQIYSSITNRVARITTKRPDWLCHKGCDQCCRQLAQSPVMTAAEWIIVQRGLSLLDSVQRTGVERRIEMLEDDQAGPITCPLLDQKHGTCLVYEQRPAICRMYGFYSAGMHNLWCDMLQNRYEAGDYDDVVLGNHVPVERAIRYNGGKSQSLRAWYLDARRDLPRECDGMISSD